MSQTLKAAPVVRDGEPTVSEDVLARIIDETARRVEMRAARPSPIHLRSWQEIERFAEKAAKSGMVPKDFVGKPDAICIAVQMGSELGLPPMQSVQNIAVVNGRPSIWGDALPGLCRASGVCKSIREWSEGEGDGLTFYCEAIRKDQSLPIVAKFSVADAKRAKLWQEKPTVARRSRDGGTYEADSGPWYSYPERMLQMRARGFALRDAFPDVLKGLLSAEEARDIPTEETNLPPIATNEPSSLRQAMNDAIPLQPLRSAAAATPRAPRKADPVVYEDAPDPLDETDGRQWLLNLDVALANAQSQDEVVAIGGHASVGQATASAPEHVKRRVSELLAKAFARFAPDGDADLDEVHIHNEEKLAAG